MRAVHGKAARERAAARFGLDSMCGAYADLYRELLAGRAARSA